MVLGYIAYVLLCEVGGKTMNSPYNFWGRQLEMLLAYLVFWIFYGLFTIMVPGFTATFFVPTVIVVIAFLVMVVAQSAFMMMLESHRD